MLVRPGLANSTVSGSANLYMTCPSQRIKHGLGVTMSDVEGKNQQQLQTVSLRYYFREYIYIYIYIYTHYK
jgi:hypothetical protein